MDGLARLTNKRIIIILTAGVAFILIALMVPRLFEDDSLATLVIAPCMTLAEVERRSDGFDLDDHRDDLGLVDGLMVVTWEKLEVRLSEDHSLTFPSGMAMIESRAEKVIKIGPETQDLPMEEWNKLEAFVHDLEANGFTTDQGAKRRLLEMRAPVVSRALTLQKANLKVELLVRALGSHFERYFTISALQECP